MRPLLATISTALVLGASCGPVGPIPEYPNERAPQRWIKIEVTHGHDARIDTVVLRKADGTEVFPLKVGKADFRRDPLLPAGSLYEVSHRPDYPSLGACKSESASYLAIGGTGAALSVGMALEVERGDRIVVLDLEGCPNEQGAAIGTTTYRVWVGDWSGLDTGRWWSAGETDGQRELVVP